MSQLVQLLQHLRNGAVSRDIDQSLSELVAAVKEQGRKASLDLTIEISPAGGVEHAMKVAANVKVKMPKKEPTLNYFFATDENLLSRTDPRQRELELEAVPGGKAKANPDAGAEDRRAAQI